MSSVATVTTIDKEYFAHPQALVESNEIGPNTKIWAFAHIMRGARIGSHCKIGDHVFIESGAFLGNHVTVKNGVAIWDRVTVEDNVFLGPNCVLTNDRNPRTYIQKPADSLTPTLIRANATVGANATIVCGVIVGRYAFIGAGTVVIRSVPDFALIVGNPGRQVGWMCVCAEKLSLPASAQIHASVICQFCGRSYVVTPHGLCCLDEESDSQMESSSL